MNTDYSPFDIETFAARFYAGAKLLITPFGYNTTFLALAQGGQLTNTINIAANADFILLGFRHRAAVGTTVGQTISTKPAPFVRMQVTDSGTNEQYTNGAVDLANYSSDGFYDNNLSYPRIVSGRSALIVQVTNYAPAAETYSTLDIFLEGVLIRVLAG